MLSAAVEMHTLLIASTAQGVCLFPTTLSDPEARFHGERTLCALLLSWMLPSVHAAVRARDDGFSGSSGKRPRVDWKVINSFSDTVQAATIPAAAAICRGCRAGTHQSLQLAQLFTAVRAGSEGSGSSSSGLPGLPRRHSPTDSSLPSRLAHVTLPPMAPTPGGFPARVQVCYD